MVLKAIITYKAEKQIVEWHEEEYFPKGQTLSPTDPEMNLEAVLQESQKRIKKEKKSDADFE